MRYSCNFLYTAVLTSLLNREQFQCHAFLPTSKLRGKSPLLRTRDFRSNERPSARVKNAPRENESNELSGSSFSALRGGDATTANDGIASYLSAISPYGVAQSVTEGYRQRVAADPEFLSKSVFEIIIAASTQYLAEVSRRGQHRIVPEIDFVFAGVLTAVFGKYYSMWKVARTQESSEDSANGDVSNGEESTWRDKVPTNAFQPTLLDGRTKPTLSSRLLAFLLPMPELFRAGVIASTVGYGLTSGLIRLRAMLMPEYVAATQPVSVSLAAVYTGVFMAFVSNVRYQLLQGVVEPRMIDAVFLKLERLIDGGESREGASSTSNFVRQLKKLAIISVRWGNGILGSWIAIGGMRACGLQKLKNETGA